MRKPNIIVFELEFFARRKWFTSNDLHFGTVIIKSPFSSRILALSFFFFQEVFEPGNIR